MTGAIENLKTYWHDEIYAESAGMDLDGFLEIKWTRVVYVKSDIPDGMHTQPFKDMNCFIEFFLLSDYYGSHPYYSHAGIAECVAFKKDGSYEVLRMNPLETYRSRTFSADFSPIISSVSDRGSDFNQSFFLAR